MEEVKLNVREYSPLTLAYIGDAVYELYVRRMLVGEKNLTVDKLHKTAIEYVKAKGQCERFYKIENILTEEEMEAFKRGRNTKSTVPKNADMHDYRIATGLEALIGYIYLSGNSKRLDEIMNIILG